MTLIEQLRGLVEAQLITEVSPEAFAFRHALTREAVYATLLKRQRAAYHALVAETLERLYGSETLLAGEAADLAYHYREAADWPKVLAYARRAGEQAQQQYAPREAAQHFSNALDAAAQLGLAPDPGLLRGRGQAYDTVGDFERARADYEAGLRQARATGQAQAEWQAVLDLGFLWGGRDYARSGDYFQQALELARAAGDPLTIAQSLNHVGLWLDNTGRASEGAQRHVEALEIFRQRGSLVDIAATRDLLALAYMLLGDIPACQAQIERAVDLFRQTDDRRGLISSLISLSTLVTNCDTLPWTRQTADSSRQGAMEALALARQIGWLSAQSQAQWLLAAALGEYGEMGEALSLAKASLQIASDIEHREWTAGAHCTLGQIYAWLLEPETALTHLERARQLGLELGSVWWIGYSGAFAALTQLQLGGVTQAQVEVQQAAGALGLEADWSQRAPANLIERYLAWAWAETALADGQPAQALAAADLLLESAINPGGEPIPNLLKLKAEALMALGRLDEAQAALNFALKGAQHHQMRPVLWQIQRGLGQLALRLGQPDEAAQQFAAARDAISEMAGTLKDEAGARRLIERGERLIQ